MTALAAAVPAAPVPDRGPLVRRPAVLGAAPLAAVLLALAAVALAGFDRRAALPSPVEGLFYGFFLDRYPLFAFVLVYALARVLAAAIAPGPASVPRRVLGAGLGLALVLALGLYPTFGGLVLRGGFVMGGMAFLNGVPLPAAHAIGAGVSAAMLAAAMGLGVVAAGQPPRPRRGGRVSRAARAAGSGIARFLALWFALTVLGAAPDWSGGWGWGLGPWPQRPFRGAEAGLAALWLGLALLPHAALSAARMRTGAGMRAGGREAA